MNCNPTRALEQDAEGGVGREPNACSGEGGLAGGGAGVVDGLYLHLPFCFHKCHYCDFYSVVEPGGRDAPRQTGFTDALVSELDRVVSTYGASLKPVTLFAGGGTPTFLRADLWERLLAKLSEHGLLRGDLEQEFTVEANPETVSAELMQRLAGGGVNRVSIGAQSFDRDALKALERWHDPESVPRAVSICRSAGIENVSLDLIFAIPGQTLAMLERDLASLIELEPSHLSTYGLTYEPNTPLTAKLRVGKVNPIEETLEREMYELVLSTLEAAGYAHYEVSNWAKVDGDRDLRCRHNLGYWRNANWLGVGPGAASHVAGHRWRNVPSLTRYIDASPEVPTEDHERLDASGRFGEQLMLGLRMSEGVASAWFDGHAALRADQRETAKEWVERGLLERVDGRLRLTRRGLFVADTVIAKLL